MRDKFAIVINALNNGLTVEVDGQKFCFGEDDNGKTHLCIEMERIDGVTRVASKVLLNSQVSFDYFYNACQKLSEQDIVSIAAGSVLINERKRR